MPLPTWHCLAARQAVEVVKERQESSAQAGQQYCCDRQPGRSVQLPSLRGTRPRMFRRVDRVEELSVGTQQVLESGSQPKRQRICCISLRP